MIANRPHIVIVAIDSLRPDHLGAYGYGKTTSPAIDVVASESVVFEHAFAAGIPTMPSFTTLYTGLHPYRHGIVAHVPWRKLPPEVFLLPQLARDAGYVTFACDNLVVQGSGTGSWFARGYDYYSGFLYQPFSDQSRQLTDRALELLREHEGGPLFLFMHYWDPHSPYGPLPPYDALHYEAGSGEVSLEEVRRIHPEYYEAFLGYMHLRHPDDYAYVVAQYDGEISQVDAQVSRLVEGLRAAGMWDDTLFVLLSDHGEAFGEGGQYFDHHGLYDAVTRIPLMIRAPGVDPRRVQALASSEDLASTLVELAGLEPPPYELTGRSLVPVLHGTGAVRDCVVSAECTRQASLALRTDRWKVILPITEDDQGNLMPDLYGRARNPAPLLYDVLEDPAERRDLSAECPQVLEELKDRLEAWRREMVGDAPDPIRSHGLTLPYDRFMERMFSRGGSSPAER